MTFDTTKEIDLSRFESSFQASRAQAKNNAKNTAKNTDGLHRMPSNAVPDGIYQASIEDLVLGHSATSGNPTLKWVLRIEGPSQQNRLLYKVNGISDRSLPYFLDELETCGVILDRFADLEKHLPSMIGLRLEIAKKTREERSNIYINKLLTAKPNLEVQDDSLPF